jgi:membrane-bound lytic murein transglycosylase
MKVTGVGRSSLIALIVVALLPGCSNGPSESELAHVQHVAAQAKAHKAAVRQRETAKKLKDQATAKAAAAHTKKVKAAKAAAARAKKLKAARAAAAHARAVKRAESAAEQARQSKARAAKAAHVRRAPQYGYQCMPGDEKRYNVCASHKAWVDGQVEYDRCINSGRTWDVAAQKCGAMDPDAGPEGDGYGNP